MIINFSENLSHLLSIDQVIGFKAYLGELIRWLLVFGFIFQLPILFMGLAHFGLIDVTQLDVIENMFTSHALLQQVLSHHQI